MVQHIMSSAIVHIIWRIWTERNARRFNNRQNCMNSLIHGIISEVALSFKLAIVKGGTSMNDFKLSQLFGIPFKSSRVDTLRDVHWLPPTTGCVKINCDGSSFGAHPCGSIGVVFRSPTHFLGAFSQNIRYASATEAEFSACMYAIENALEMQLKDICVETDSLMVFKSFSTPEGVRWRMRNR